VYGVPVEMVRRQVQPTGIRTPHLNIPLIQHLLTDLHHLSGITLDLHHKHTRLGVISSARCRLPPHQAVSPSPPPPITPTALHAHVPACGLARSAQ
jgi:hypothetical protein